MSAGPNERRLNRWEIGAGLVLFALGAFMALKGLGYSVGSITRMGPGFFPVAVGIALMLLSIGIVVEVRRSATPAPDLPLRPLAFIIAGLVVFSIAIESLGLVPATFILVFISAFADSGMTALRALVVAAAMSALGYAVFVLGFRLPLDPFWW